MSHPNLKQPRSLDDMVLFRLWWIGALAGRKVIRMCDSEFGVTRREWRVMTYLARHDSVLPSELAEYAGLDRARTSRTIGNLVDKHLVHRQPRPSNRREALLTLTDAGRDLHDRLMPRVAAINAELMEPLTEEDARVLAGLLQRLQHQAEQMGDEGDAI
jgi:DNA-binding MarR family transcriptional regulator